MTYDDNSRKWSAGGVIAGIIMLEIILLPGGAGAVPVEEWNRTFGGAGNDIAHSVKPTSDGGYILTGWTESYGAGKKDAWLIKTDKNGSEQWNKSFGGTGDEEVSSIQQTSDGGYILSGYTNSHGAGNAWLIKTDTNGNERWNKTFSGGAHSVNQTLDGGYIIAGVASLPSGAPMATWILKTDANGNEQWNRTFGGGRGDWANSIQQNSDCEYIIAGRMYIPGGAMAWLIKTDIKGNEQWSKTFWGKGGGGKGGGAEANAVEQTLDGGYIIAGLTKSHGAGNSDILLMKTDGDGNEQWNKTFGEEGNDKASSVWQTLDLGYIIAGRKERSYGNTDAWLIKTDANGNEQWNKILEGRQANFVQQTSDNGYILAGDTFSDKTESLDAWLIKISIEPTARVQTASPTEMLTSTPTQTRRTAITEP